MRAAWGGGGGGGMKQATQETLNRILSTQQEETST